MTDARLTVSSRPSPSLWDRLVGPMKVTAGVNLSAGIKGFGGWYGVLAVTASAADEKGHRRYSGYEATGGSIPVAYVGVAHTEAGTTPTGGVSLPFVSIGNDPVTGKTVYVSVFGVGNVLIGSNGAIGGAALFRLPFMPAVSAGPGFNLVDPRLAEYTKPVIDAIEAKTHRAAEWFEAEVTPTIKEVGRAIARTPPKYFPY